MRKDTIIQTPYGRGLIYNTKKNPNKEDEPIHCLKLTSINLANNTKPILYTCQTDFPSALPLIDDDIVIDGVGRGAVDDVRDDGIVVVLLNTWRLAGRSRVRIYTPLSSFSKDNATYHVVRKKRLFEMDIFEKIEYSKVKKQEAIPYFVQGRYDKALSLFSEATNAVRMQQHSPNSSNEMRADLVEIMITCSNNAASCYVKKKEWKDAQQQARNALLIIDALDQKRGMKIHTILRQGGLSDLKMFGEWRIKSMLIIARAEAEEQEYVMAIPRLKAALSHTRTSLHVGARVIPGLEKQDKEIRKLIQTYGERQRAILQKEKARAKAMFGGKTATSKSKSSSAASVAATANKPVEVHAPSKAEIDVVQRTVITSKDVDPIKKAVPKRAVDVNGGATNSSSQNSIKTSVEESIPAKNSDSDGEDDNNVDASWYEEHQEAIILSSIIGGIGLVTLGLKALARGGASRA